jgi:ketosteroid isomerase-like protein
MSQANVEIVRQLYGQWSRGEFWGLAKLLAEDVTFWSELPPGEVLCHGPQEIDGFFREFLRQWRDYRIEGDDFIDLGGDAVLVVGRQTGAGAQSGAPTEQPLSIGWTLRDGLITSMFCAIERDRALKAAGYKD